MKSGAQVVAALGVLATLFAHDVEGTQPIASWRDPSPHQLRWVTVDSSVRLEVLDWGGSGPPLVLLGCYLTAHAYDEIAPKLTDQFHVYGITRRGIGASDRPAGGYSVQRSADDVVEVLDSLGVEKSILVGTSCAGQVLTLFASRHSGRLSGLVYLDGAGDPTTPAYDPPMPDLTKLPRPLRNGPRVTLPDAERRAPPFHSGSSAGDHGGREDKARLYGHSSARPGNLSSPAAVRGGCEAVRYPDRGRARRAASRTRRHTCHVYEMAKGPPGCGSGGADCGTARRQSLHVPVQ